MEAAAPPASRLRTERLERIWKETPGFLGWVTTTDHKRIGILYFFTAIAFFLAGGVEALLIRTQLIGPNNTVLSPEAFDQVMTMHGVTMIFLFVIPMSIGAFGNYLLPLMIGARDMAFPRMNALSYWIYLCSGIFLYVGLLGGNGPNAGWFDYVPLASKTFSPGPGIDFYALGLMFNGISTLAAAINFIVTIFKLRAPGMKKWNPSSRSSSSRIRAVLSAGRAKTSAKETARKAKQKSGIRFSDMPGARSLNTLTITLIAPAVVEMPTKSSPSA